MNEEIRRDFFSKFFKMKEIKKEETIFISFDGKIFTDKGECLKHQKIQIKINIVASFLMVALVTFVVLTEMKIV